MTAEGEKKKDVRVVRRERGGSTPKLLEGDE